MRKVLTRLFGRKRSRTPNWQKEHDRVLAQLDFQRFMVLIAAVLGQIVSLGLSFSGTVYNLERDGGVTFETVGAAFMVSVVIAAFQLIGWWILLDTKNYPTAPRKVAGLGLTLAFLSFGFGTSSYFNYSSITAPSATTIYLGDQIDERINEFAALRLKADAAKQLFPLVRGEKEAGCSAAKLERDTGIYSGSKGKGLVSGALDGICGRSTEAEAAITAAVQTNEDNAKRAVEVIDQLELALIAVNEPILVRERVIVGLIRDLDEMNREVRGARMTESVKAFFETLVTSVAALGPQNANDFQGTQNTVLAALRQGFEERLPVIEDMIAKVDAIEVPEITLDNRPSVHELMRYSVGQHPQNVLLALGIDSFVAFMIAVLLVKGPKPRPTPTDPRNPRK
ncbi:MAG: hypothetical protein AAGD13_14920 [Pseudomonadota bacterium]